MTTTKAAPTTRKSTPRKSTPRKSAPKTAAAEPAPSPPLPSKAERAAYGKSVRHLRRRQRSCRVAGEPIYDAGA
jgi:hypothetical protein